MSKMQVRYNYNDRWNHDINSHDDWKWDTWETMDRDLVGYELSVKSILVNAVPKVLTIKYSDGSKVQYRLVD